MADHYRAQAPTHNDALSREDWTCRRCCRSKGARFIPSRAPDATCADCGDALTDMQRLAALMVVLMSRLPPEVTALNPTMPRLLTVPEAARMLRLKPKTIYARIAANEMEFIKTGGRVLIPSDRLLRSLKQKGSPSSPSNRSRRWE